MANGHGSKFRTPSELLKKTTMGGAPTPKWDRIGFDPQPNVKTALSMVSTGESNITSLAEDDAFLLQLLLLLQRGFLAQNLGYTKTWFTGSGP